jgi:hypothetical protein
MGVRGPTPILSNLTRLTTFNVALLDSISPGDPGGAMEALIQESSEVVGWFNEAAQGIMVVAAEQYLKEDDGSVPLETIDIGPVPIAEENQIFFT